MHFMKKRKEFKKVTKMNIKEEFIDKRITRGCIYYILLIM